MLIFLFYFVLLILSPVLCHIEYLFSIFIKLYYYYIIIIIIIIIIYMYVYVIMNMIFILKKNMVELKITI